MSDWNLAQYLNKLNSHNESMEWYRGTGLKPYLDVLLDEKKKAFEQDVFDTVIKEYPIQKKGSIIITKLICSLKENTF